MVQATHQNNLLKAKTPEQKLALQNAYQCLTQRMQQYQEILLTMHNENIEKEKKQKLRQEKDSQKEEDLMQREEKLKRQRKKKMKQDLEAYKQMMQQTNPNSLSAKSATQRQVKEANPQPGFTEKKKMSVDTIMLNKLKQDNLEDTRFISPPKALQALDTIK